MKTRLGFVSNSSATSYIIAYNPKDFEICEHCGRGMKDPLVLIKESAYLRPSHTEIDCESGEKRITDLISQIEILKNEMEEASKRPAGEVYDQERFADMDVTDNPFVERVWSHISFCDHRIKMLERQIKLIKRKLEEGKHVLWAAIYYDDPTGKVLQKMIDNKTI